MLLWLGAALLGLAAIGVAVSATRARRAAYAAPWLLVVGPGHGRSSLAPALDATLTSHRGLGGWLFIARQLGLHAWRSSDGVIVDVAGAIAVPPDHGRPGPWRRALRLLRRHRPRRPIDGVILAIPAPLLREGGPALRAVGEAIHARLIEVQRYCGALLPAYVVVTEGEALPGFTDLVDALPFNLRGGILGWSNDGTAATVRDAVAGDPSAVERLAFRGEWVRGGMTTVVRDLAPVLARALAASQGPSQAAGLLRISGELSGLANPLAGLLEEALRPNLYQPPCFLRGVYVCGEGGFAETLLQQRMFRESSLAVPRADAALTFMRQRLAAQVAAVVLLVILGVGTAWSYWQWRDLQPAYARLIATGTTLASSTSPEPAPSAEALADRLVRRRAFLDEVIALRRGRLREIATRLFMPASRATDQRLARVVALVFTGLLDDMRQGLQARWDEWQRTATLGPGDRGGPLGPDLKETAPYKAVERFTDGYQRFTESYERYIRLGRAASAGDLSAASGIFEYLTGTGLSGTAVSPSIGRAVRAVRATPIACTVFTAVPPDGGQARSLVAIRAAELSSAFAELSFDTDAEDEERARNVLAGTARFAADWSAMAEDGGDDRAIATLMDDMNRLAQAVRTWTAFRGPSRAIAIPAFGKAPFARHPPADGFCDELRPDLARDTRSVEQLRDQLTVRLLDETADPFGRLLEYGEGGLAFTPAVADFKNSLDDLQRQPFWQQVPANLGVTLPLHPSWRQEDIDAATQVANAFEVYRGGAFRQLELSYRTPVLAAVEAAVAQVVSSTLAGRAATARAAVSQADAMTRLGTQLTALQRLLPWLQREPELGSTILRRLDAEAVSGLDEIDRSAAAGYFLARRQGTPTTSGDIFATWRGLLAAAPAADAQKRWSAIVDDQRNAVRQAALLARPIADYLAGRQASERTRRWSALAGDVADFDAKRPGNSLNALDLLLREGLPEMVPERGCGAAAEGGPSAGTGAFDAVRGDLVREGLRQCLDVRYATIAVEFRQRLANRFPFSRTVDTAVEAPREAVAEFLRIFEREGGRSMVPLLTANACRQDAARFINQVSTLYPLLTSLAPAPPPAPGQAEVAPRIALDVIPEFRFAADEDQGGSQIAEWELVIDNQAIPERAVAKPVTWMSNASVLLNARFARDSPARPPLKAPATPPVREPLTVEDRRVRWSFGGEWALLRLIGAGRENDIRQPRGVTPAPITLGFQIPVEPDASRVAAGTTVTSPFTVYLRLAVSPAGKPFPLEIGPFPFDAPVSADCAGR